jgi:glycosyltransferase involved in cell wall biosynthesis
MSEIDITVIIPAYNEEQTISSVVNNVKRYATKVIVVDDASKDRTKELASDAGAQVLRTKTNQGYDKALDVGFNEAAKSKPGVIITFDADGQHVPNDIPKMIDPIKNNQADVVVGIRPYNQRIAEKIFSIYARRKIGIRDPLCGIKAYSIKAYNEVGYFDRVKSIGTELLFNCHKRGYRIKEVNIQMNKREGKPRFGNVFRSNLRIFAALLRIYLKFR